jgi:hypothetical protein
VLLDLAFDVSAEELSKTEKIMPFTEVIANLLKPKPEPETHRDRRMRNLDQHINMLVRSMEMTNDSRTKALVQKRIDDVRERLGKFVVRKPVELSERRHQ